MYNNIHNDNNDIRAGWDRATALLCIRISQPLLYTPLIPTKYPSNIYV